MIKLIDNEDEFEEVNINDFALKMSVKMEEASLNLKSPDQFKKSEKVQQEKPIIEDEDLQFFLTNDTYMDIYNLSK